MVSDNTNTVMPVAPMGGNGGFGGSWGGDWSAWIVLFLIFGMFGMGGWGNGWGGNGGGMNNAFATLPLYSQSNDFSNLERENDIIRQDICSNFANVNQTLANGFQGIQTSFANAELSRSNTQAALMGQMYNMSLASQQQASDNAMNVMQGFNGVQQGLSGINYNLAQQGCDTRNTIQNTTRDIIDSQNCGTRAILDALTAQRIADKDQTIAMQNQQIFGLQLAASQQAQNAYLLQTLRPYPIPTFTVVPPGTTPDAGAAAKAAVVGS